MGIYYFSEYGGYFVGINFGDFKILLPSKTCNSVMLHVCNLCVMWLRSFKVSTSATSPASYEVGVAKR